MSELSAAVVYTTLEFAREEHREIGEFIELRVSSRRSPRRLSEN